MDQFKLLATNHASLYVWRMNTRLTYLYRDASNYKQWNEVVVEGQIDAEALQALLWEGNFFIPQAVGLPPLQERFATDGYGFPNEDDHAWHEIEGIEDTNDAPTRKESAAELAERFQRAAQHGWESWLAAATSGLM